MKVPFVDVSLESREIRPRVLQRLEHVIQNSNFILGAEVVSVGVRWALSYTLA